MKKSDFDLHMHSFYSDDGEYSPGELVTRCQNAGIHVMAMADHNSVRGVREACEKAAELGILCIPAIEIDTVFESVNIHVLGYGIDIKSEDFGLIEENITRQSKDASWKMFQKTQKLGFTITTEELEALENNENFRGRWTGEMFAEVLLARAEYRDHELLKPYRPGGERGDNPFVNFYWDYFAQGKPCHAEVKYPALAEVLRVIHKNGGKAVLAHPGLYSWKRPEQLGRLLESGLDGVEAFSSYHTTAQAEEYRKKAEKWGLFSSGGSDFHGKIKPSVRLGEFGCPFLAQEMEFTEILRK